MFRHFKAILVVGAVLVGGGSFVFTKFFGDGTLHIMTVGGGAVTLAVDGLPLLEKDRVEDHFTYKVSQGQHEVKVTDIATNTTTTYSVDVPSGFSAILLPVRADQCFVRFDMTDAAYSSGKGQPPPVASTYKNKGEPISLPSGTSFTFGELPRKRRKSQSVYLMRDVPCALTSVDVKKEVLLLALSEQADELFTNAGAFVNDQE